MRKADESIQRGDDGIIPFDLATRWNQRADGGIFPVDLYIATLWKKMSKATRFIHVVKAGTKMSELKHPPLYTPAIQSDIEKHGFAVYKDESTVRFVCTKVTPAVIIAYRNEVKSYLDVVTTNLNTTIQLLSNQLESPTGGGADA